MPRIVELRPNRDLINASFEKYQFCSESIPIIDEINLKEDVYRLELSSSQESLLEVRLFALHNHLFKNPNDGSSWFIDKHWAVWRFHNGLLERMHLLHDSLTNVSNVLYNPSIGFTTNNSVVISDGGDCLRLMVEEKDKSMKLFTLNDSEPGVILDIRYIEAKSTIIVAMSAIESNGDKKFTRVLLLSYAYKNLTDSFQFVGKEILRVRGAMEYVHIEESGDYIHSINQDLITFENPKSQESASNKVEPNDESKIKIPKYCWSQDEDSLMVWIKVEEKHRKKVTVNVNSNELSVLFDDSNVLIQGECQHRLDESLTTWKHEGDTFRLDLVKLESGLMWTELIKGDTGGECLPNEALAANVHSRLAHLCTDQTADKLQGQPCIGFNAEQLEECDLEGRDNYLQRIDLVSQQTTDMTTLGTNNHILFTYKTNSGQKICLRHDHDGCVWVTGTANDTQWDIKHIHTFPGFGYVEASKSNKKFCLSPVDDSYVAILEHTRHIFLYERPKSNVKVGKQWIVDLGSETLPIMGAVANNKHLIVLTTNKLYRLQIYL